MFDQEKTLVASTWKWRGEHPPRDYAPRLQLARQFFPTTREDRHRQVPGFVYWGNRKPSAGGAASGASASAAVGAPPSTRKKTHPAPDGTTTTVKVRGVAEG